MDRKELRAALYEQGQADFYLSLAHSAAERPGRDLSDQEIKLLKAQGNTSPDWSLVKVAPVFTAERIHSTHFFGRCFIGVFGPFDSPDRPVGVYNSTVKDSRIEDGVSLLNSTVVGYRIGADSLVWNSCLIQTEESCFGNGTKINLGPETGGRTVAVFADLNFNFLARAFGSSTVTEELAALRQRVARLSIEMCALCSSRTGTVGPRCQIRSCASIERSYIGEGSQITAAVSLSSSTLVSTPGEPIRIGPGAMLDSALLQPACEVSGASVRRSLLCEHSSAEDGASVSSSVIAPNTSVGRGEVAASLVGPFIGMHHESLLIASLWPEGRGNLGYGARVGSNHSSRAPDQECRPGEGQFFGLGCGIAFPANFGDAPYTFVAAGANVPSGRYEYPFSLILPAGSKGSRGRLIPAWALSANIFAVLRAELKFKDRNRARRNEFVHDAFSERICALMDRAAERLELVLGNAAGGQEEFVGSDVLGGISSLVVAMKDIRVAAEAYRFYARFGRLRRHAAEDDAGAERAPEYEDALERVRAACRESRGKDFERGTSIIDDYTEVHGTRDEDELLSRVLETL